jgi:hypothetical protein
MTRWTTGASFPPESRLRYERYGMGMGLNDVEGAELLGHTGFVGAFAFYARGYDAVLVVPTTPRTSIAGRLAALCRELRAAG